MRSIGYEESFNNHYSVVNYGTFLVLDVLKLNGVAGVFFQVAAWSLAQMPNWKLLKALCDFWVCRCILSFSIQNISFPLQTRCYALFSLDEE